MTARARANVYTIPAGRPFLDTLVEALLEDRLDIGLSVASGPLSLADATIFVPTRRAVTALAAALSRAAAGPLLLPRIVPLGGLGEIEDGLLVDGLFDDDDLPPAVDDLERRLELARLTTAWSREMRHALLAAGRGASEAVRSEPIAVGASITDAFALAGDLARLLDEMELAGVDWEDLAKLAPDHDPYWALTTDFLKIVSQLWPAHLAERGLIDPADRQNRLLAAETARLRQAPPDTPMIVAGSTGSVPATAALMRAISRLPRGAIILPGLDQALDRAGWEAVGTRPGATDAASAGHPQATLKRLIERLDAPRETIVALGEASPALALRERILSEAMRPADTTHLWRQSRLTLGEAALAAGLDGVSLLEATDEQQEAVAIALLLREALETAGRTAALVTPDRALARRVASELARWDIAVEDSAGLDLPHSQAGALARLAAAAFESDFAAPAVLALLDHGAVTCGLSRERLVELAAGFEIAACRGRRVAGGLAGLAEAARQAVDRQQEPHVAAALRRLPQALLLELPALVAAVESCFAPLTVLGAAGADLPWAAAAAAFGDCLQRLIEREEPPVLSGLAELMDRLDAVAGLADARLTVDRASFGALTSALMQGVAVRTRPDGHPRLRILGLLEARLLPLDLAVLGGLNEGTWPPAARTDAFLNRPMRAALGLDPPERRIGQTAHDFCQALGHGEVVLTRALRVDGEPTIASRFLRRLAAFAGPAWREVAGRGRRPLDLARRLDTPDTPPAPARRPEPRPPVALRPTRISVTAVETLYRDPYAIHARDILKLEPLEEVCPRVDAAERGNLVHEALQAFLQAPLPADRAARFDGLIDCGRQAFAPLMHEPEVSAFWWPRFLRMADWFLDEYEGREATIARSLTERSGRLDLTLADGSRFLLSGRADRIDMLSNGGIAILDYKTGSPPGNKEVLIGLAPQLTLLGAMARSGVFRGVPEGEAVEELAYLKLGDRTSIIKPDGETLEAVIARHFAMLEGTLNRYRDEATGYVSRRLPRERAASGDYDHLARVREWSDEPDAEEEA